ncbi:MAG TPA: NAD(P)-dependent oxidoreductase [Pseudomonadales bacterium]
MNILITGAFGRLGLMCVEQASAMGHQLRCFDIDSPATRKAAEAWQGRAEIIFGDLRDEALLPQLVDGVDAIIHNASLLPPLTDTLPELAEAVNVTACKKLIDIAASQGKKPVFVFPSSVTVFGQQPPAPKVYGPDDPVAPSDNYTRHKVIIEQALRDSSLPWVVVRVGVSVDSRTLKTDRATFRKLLDVHPDNPVEWVHPKDVALAMCQAVQQPQAVGKVLLLGGGKDCQVTQRNFLRVAFDALGLHLPESVHGRDSFYTHWMDTTESQRILGFQQHSFADYRAEMAARLKLLRLLLAPLRWLVNPLLAIVLQRL